MKTLVIGRQVQRLGVGALVLALSTALAAPLPAVAKEKRAEAVNVSKSAVNKAKTAKAKTTKTTKSRTTQTAKTTQKAYKQRHAKSKHKKSRKSPVTQATQQAHNAPRQPYYLIPANVGQIAQPQAAPQTPVTAAAAMPAANQRNAEVYQVGKASYYSTAFHGKKTASGERYDQNDLTCAHGSLPFGCRIRVTNLSNRKSVEVKVNDRGAFHEHGRVIDLSKAAAQEIGIVSSGTAKVQIEVLE